MTETQAFRPDWVSHPGETIEDLLEEREWTQAELARRTGFTRKHVNELVKGNAGISSDAALRLESVLGSSAEFWMQRDSQYREAMQRRQHLDRLKADAEWLETLPIGDMTRRGWIQRRRNKAEQVAECLKFFGVASVTAWRKQYEKPLVAFRASKAFDHSVGAIAAWVRQAERQAQEIFCEPYDTNSFKSTLQRLRRLTEDADPKSFVPTLVDLCAACGVAVVFVPTPKGCPASGATRWLSPHKALLVLSLRHKSNDHLWFTFFHEAGHLVLHSKKLQFIDFEDGSEDQREQEADRFARDLLIPLSATQELEKLAAGGRVSKAQVLSFARRWQVAPGIVVGRMQKEGWLPWSHLNGLKVRYSWAGATERLST
ncbi:MAG: HigA family addiction module antitoxin [Acidobacteriota bacterium]|nr:HigA family addiction module antitoxin [Acidobacteriota bacterium]